MEISGIPVSERTFSGSGAESHLRRASVIGCKFYKMIPNFWKELVDPSDIFACLQPVLILTHLMGITPFRLVGDIGERNLKSCILGFLNAVCHVIIFSYCYISSIVHHKTMVGYFFNTNISKIGDMLQMVTGLAGVTCIYMCAMVNRQTLKDAIYLLAEVDEELKEIGARVQYKKTLHTFLIVFTISVFLDIGYILGSHQILRSANIDPYPQACLSFFLPHMMTSFVVVLFFASLKLIEHRFALLNKVMITVQQRLTVNAECKRKKVLKSLDSTTFDKFSSLAIVSKSPEEIIDKCRQAHNTLVDSSCIFDCYFSMTMLMIVTTSFLIIVFDMYYILEIFFGFHNSQFKISPAKTIVFFLCQLVAHIFVILGAVLASSGTICESLKTSSHVHQMINSSASSDLREKLVYFSLQLVHRKVNFTAAGLFNIDRTLIFTLTGAATTYLVILLQFTTSDGQYTPSSINETVVL